MFASIEVMLVVGLEHPLKPLPRIVKPAEPLMRQKRALPRGFAIAIVLVTALSCKPKPLPTAFHGEYRQRFRDREATLTVLPNGLRYDDAQGRQPLVNPVLFDATDCSSDSSCSFRHAECSGSISKTSADEVAVTINKFCIEMNGTWSRTLPAK